VTLTLQPVRVATGGPDEEGCLVFSEGRLIAVLVRLSEEHGERSGEWFFEAGFGRLDGPAHPTFAAIEDAQDWIERRLRQPGHKPIPS
jgi:hypothetical protein